MFKWWSDSSGLKSMMRDFLEMLGDGRHTFDAATHAFLGGDPEVVREDLFRTDKNINHLERKIRREIVVHGTVHGAVELPACLVMMSIVKDAERIGDYSKNLFDLAIAQPKQNGDAVFDDLVDMRARVSRALGDAKTIYGAQDEAAAQTFLRNGDALQDHCDRKVEQLLGPEPGTTQPTASALCYRYYKRVLAHAINIITSIVMPVDKLDYLDEDQRTRDSAD